LVASKEHDDLCAEAVEVSLLGLILTEHSSRVPSQ
jgi:hypothetical protein